MSSIGKAIGGIVGGVTGAAQAAEGAQQAAETQAQAARDGIQFQREALGESRRQFDTTQANLQPFLAAGQQATGSLTDLLGLNGLGRQTTAFSAVENSPVFAGIARQGENAILQRAAATGGLRGGNTQAALAQFRPQLLQQFLNDQYTRLGGLAQLGTGTGSNLGQLGAQFSQAGQAGASNIANLLGQQGQALAGGQIAAGNQTQRAFGQLASIASAAAGAGAFGGGAAGAGGGLFGGFF